MDQAAALPALQGGQVIHLAGKLTEDVVGFLGPLTAALADSGARQVLVAHEPREPGLIARLDPSVEVHLLPSGRSAARRWIGTWCELRALLADARALRAVHLHGFLPALLAPYALRGAVADVPVVHSSHASEALGTLRALGWPLWWMTRPVGRRHSGRAIATVPTDVQRWRSLSAQPVDFVERPVSSAFFEVERLEAPSPLVAAGTVGRPDGSGMVAQLKVLLNDDEASLVDFKWIGAAPGVRTAARLRAAGVDVVDAGDDETRAAHLAQAWVYLMPACGKGFPLQLGEAMAVGLPCVAVDTPTHRSLIRDGESGFLCKTTEDVVVRLRQLLGSRELRERIGQQAQLEASGRLTERCFRDSLFAAYESSVSRPMPLGQPGLPVALMK